MAFVTFNTHEEAKRAVDHFKSKYHYNEFTGENSHVNEEDYNVLNNSEKIENPLGHNVNISLAFSQQAMQTKKKIKESRKKPATSNVIITNTPAVGSNNNIAPTVPIINSQLNAINAPLNKSNFDTTAMLAMMNLINLNKVIKIN